jgi:hypothetical protein
MGQKRNSVRDVEVLGGLDSDYPPEARTPRRSGLRPTRYNEPYDGAFAEDVTIQQPPPADLMALSHDDEDRTLGMSVDLQQRLQILAAAGMSPPTEDAGHPTPLIPPAPGRASSGTRFERTTPMLGAPRTVFAERTSWQWIRSPAGETRPRPTTLKRVLGWLWCSFVIVTALLVLASLLVLGLSWPPR